MCELEQDAFWNPKFAGKVARGSATQHGESENFIASIRPQVGLEDSNIRVKISRDELKGMRKEAAIR
jgi:hypothetical protein